MDLIKREQAKGKLVAMTGDGTTTLRTGPGRRGRGMNSVRKPRKKPEHGRSRLQSHQADRNCRDRQTIAHDARRAHTFSIANDVAKYFAIIPAMFAASSRCWRTQHHASGLADSAILSAVVFNAVIIVALIPLASRSEVRAQTG